MKKVLIILAAGHGGKDTGAVSGTAVERDQAIVITDAVADLLKKVGFDVHVCPHDQDTHETIPYLNRKFGDGAFSGPRVGFEIHRDSASGLSKQEASLRCGIYHSGSTRSAKFAGIFVNALEGNGATAASWSRNQNESRFHSLGFINQVEDFRTFIVEAGFVEGQQGDDHMNRLAHIIAAGVIAGIAGCPEVA